MAIHSKRILITGISGFTGFHLAKALRNMGHEVHGTSITTLMHEHEHQCDLRNAQQIHDLVNEIRPTHIIHLAAISFVNEKNISLMYDVNVIGTCNLLDALCENGTHIEKIIVSSSAAVYGEQNQEILNEEMCPKPKNHYGCSKLAMEHMVMNYTDKLPVIIVRPFNYTGLKQEQHFIIPKIVSHFKAHKSTIELGNIDVFREFNDINFIVDIYCKLLFSDITNEILNIASGRVFSLNEVIMIMQEIAGYPIQINTNQNFIRKNEIKKMCGSTVKLKHLLGEIVQSTLKETLTKMYKECL